MKIHNSCILAPNESIKFDDPRIKYPMFGSVKFDGIRCIILNGTLFSRYMKPFKNIQLTNYFSGLIEVSKYNNLVFDMEIYDPNENNFGNIISYGSSLDKNVPETVKGFIFDAIGAQEWESKQSKIFKHRYDILKNLDSLKTLANVSIVEQRLLNNAHESFNYFEECINNNQEGIMLRSPNGYYKYGRCSVRECNLLKFKKFVTIDGTILDVFVRNKMKDEVKNGERKLNPFGNKEVIHTKDSFEESDIAGGFLVKFDNGIECKVNYGRGYDLESRRQHLLNKDNLIGKRIEVSYMSHGMKDKLRLPTFIRFRPDQD